jgi:hypothetical protein
VELHGKAEITRLLIPSQASCGASRRELVRRAVRCTVIYTTVSNGIEQLRPGLNCSELSLLRVVRATLVFIRLAAPGIHSRVALSAGAIFTQSTRRQGQPLARSHCSIPGARPPPPHCTCPRSRGSRSQPLPHFKLPTSRRHHACTRTPVAAVVPRPLEHSKVPALRRRIARNIVPGADVRARSLEHSEVPVSRRLSARVRVPGAAVAPHPLEHSEGPTAAARVHGTIVIQLCYPGDPVSPGQ